jgi:hypothetical protein
VTHQEFVEEYDALDAVEALHKMLHGDGWSDVVNTICNQKINLCNRYLRLLEGGRHDS